MTQKRTCNKCKGLYEGSSRFSCKFGYKIQEKRKEVIGHVFITLPIPAEPCPKPLTWDEWWNCKYKEEP